MKRKVIALLIAAVACAGVGEIPKVAHDDIPAMLLLIVVLFALAVVVWRGKRQLKGKKQTGKVMKNPASLDISANYQEVQNERQHVQQDAPAYSFVGFNLSGVTFPNDEGMDRQELLRRIDEMLPPFENGGDLDVKLKPVKFRGEDAIECRVNGCQIGYVPKEKVADVLAAMKKPDATISGFQVVGGTDGLNYGVSMSVRFANERGGRR